MDEGTISAKDILPITSFAYGPLINGMEGQANFSIGQLKCFGKVNFITVFCISFLAPLMFYFCLSQKFKSTNKITLFFISLRLAIL